MPEQRISEEQVRHVALLSRLDLSGEEIDRFTRDLNEIIDYVGKLNELDTAGVPPTSHPIPLKNVFREDEPRPSLANDQALANAPDSEGPFFRVPQIIQEG
jgi:aspartyl-tRNA(Asn)/glutamyl-tRNA(Gln) amidotransferase subunit C